MAYRGGTSRFFKRAEIGGQLRAGGRAAVRPRPHPLHRGDGQDRPARRGVPRRCWRSARSGSISTFRRPSRARATPTSAAPTPRSRTAGRRAASSAGSGPGGSGVKGGWRVYSSGPGIFINQLISNVLGLRTLLRRRGVRPGAAAAGRRTDVRLRVRGPPVRYLYHVAGDGFSPPRGPRQRPADCPAGGTRPTPTGRAACSSRGAAFGAALDRDENLVEIFV